MFKLNLNSSNNNAQSSCMKTLSLFNNHFPNENSIMHSNTMTHNSYTFQLNNKTKSNIKCKCKNSKCLKNYCECFSNGQFCKGGCHCSNCFNTALLEDKVNKAKQIQYIKKPKSLNVSSVVVCKCTKSFCHKKYCECYNKGVPCNDKCKCKQCRNKEHNESICKISEKLNEINYTNRKRERRNENVKKKFVINRNIVNMINELHKLNEKKEAMNAKTISTNVSENC